MKKLIFKKQGSARIALVCCVLGLFNYAIAQTSGRGNISKFNSDWSLSTVMEDNNWYNKWDKILAIDIDNDGEDELLCYAKISKIADRGKAQVDIYDVSSSGDLKLIKRHKNWLKIWDKIVAADFDGDGKSELLCYSKNSPQAQPGYALADIYDVSGSGVFRLIKRHKNWFKGWDELKILNIDSNPDREMLCYAKNSTISEPGRALADIYKIARNGDVKLIKRHKNWFNKWDDLIIIDADNDNKKELLCYSKNSGIAPKGKGLGDIYDISSAGDVKLIKRHTNWYNGWSQIVFDNFGGANKGYGGPSNGELFFYGGGNKYGISQTANISANGVLTTLKSNNKMNPHLDIALSIKKDRGSVSNLLLYSKKFGSSSNLKPFGYKARAGWSIESPSVKGELLGTRNVAWIIADFPDGPQELNSNLNSTALNKISKYYQEVSEGRFILKNVPIIGPIKIDKGCADFPVPFNENFRNYVIEKANEKSLNVKNYDTSPRDGIVTPQELGITIISNCPAGTNGAAAIIEKADVNLSFTKYRGGVASGGANTNLLTMTHEVAHFYGAFDLYPDTSKNRQCNCWGATLMEETINTVFNRPLIHLDPFHRLIFGWLEPRVFDLSKFPPSKINIGLTRGGKPIKNSKSPFILFNSKKGYKEYYIIEYRAKGSEYDKAVDGEGVAIWHVDASENGKFRDKDIKLIKSQTKTFWNSKDGSIKLKWTNGENLPVSISVDPISSNSKEVTLRMTPQ
jgi:M6 family metalloprotease-like protein